MVESNIAESKPSTMCDKLCDIISCVFLILYIFGTIFVAILAIIQYYNIYSTNLPTYNCTVISIGENSKVMYNNNYYYYRGDPIPVIKKGQHRTCWIGKLLINDPDHRIFAYLDIATATCELNGTGCGAFATIIILFPLLLMLFGVMYAGIFAGINNGKITAAIIALCWLLEIGNWTFIVWLCMNLQNDLYMNMDYVMTIFVIGVIVCIVSCFNIFTVMELTTNKSIKKIETQSA